MRLNYGFGNLREIISAWGLMMLYMQKTRIDPLVLTQNISGFKSIRLLGVVCADFVDVAIVWD
jgi:hypothetical protein